MEQRPVLGAKPYYAITADGRLLNTERGTEVKPFLGTDKYLHFPLTLADGRKTNKRAHRLVYEAFYGPLRTNEQIDHLNGIRTDNRLENLEKVTCRENIHRSRKNGDKCEGIFWRKSHSRWVACIYLSGHKYYLLETSDKDLAKAAYDKALGDWEKFGKLPEKKGRGGARPGAGRKARSW